MTPANLKQSLQGYIDDLHAKIDEVKMKKRSQNKAL